MGEIQDDQLDDPVQAIAAYRKAHQIDDINLEVLDALERLHRRSQQWDGLIEVLRRKAELCEEPDQVMDLRARIGELFEEEVGDAARAVESYKDVLAIDPQTWVP
jgi:tetratricopeptide (TPR) repeat protein